MDQWEAGAFNVTHSDIDRAAAEERRQKLQSTDWRDAVSKNLQKRPRSQDDEQSKVKVNRKKKNVLVNLGDAMEVEEDVEEDVNKEEVNVEVNKEKKWTKVERRCSETTKSKKVEAKEDDFMTRKRKIFEQLEEMEMEISRNEEDEYLEEKSPGKEKEKIKTNATNREKAKRKKESKDEIKNESTLGKLETAADEMEAEIVNLENVQRNMTDCQRIESKVAVLNKELESLILTKPEHLTRKDILKDIFNTVNEINKLNKKEAMLDDEKQNDDEKELMIKMKMVRMYSELLMSWWLSWTMKYMEWKEKKKHWRM